uniref:Ubiquitin conjugating enzyme E2 E3 n=1 Tax=Equus asinus TaxID=9793 RepID=A0A9L0K429_EQUAS
MRGREEPSGWRRREATARGGLPRPLRLAGSSRPRPAELPPPSPPKALGGATLRPEPGTAQPPPTFNVPHSPARASSASFFPSPPFFPPPAASISLRKGFFALALPHTVAARERAGGRPSFSRNNFTKMSSDRQRSDDESPSTSSGSSDADQRDPAAPEPEEQEERKPSATQQKKNTKLSSKTTAKLSTSAKRIQKELAEITLDPPPNCSVSRQGPPLAFGLGVLCLGRH